MTLEVRPLTPDAWDDFTRLFGPNGASAGCWCMFWRVWNEDYRRLSGPGLRDRMKSIVEEGRVPGLLGYLEGEPAGWVSLGEREEFVRLQRSRKLQPVDEVRVWSVVCFFVHRRHRRGGIAGELLEAAAAHARRRGAAVLEGYPVDTGGEKAASGGLYTGTLEMFLAAGFEEVARREGRPIVRREL